MQFTMSMALEKDNYNSQSTSKLNGGKSLSNSSQYDLILEYLRKEEHGSGLWLAWATQ